MNKKSSIIVLDFGSQYTQLIARRIRKLSVYSEILPYDVDCSTLLEHNPDGIILSGGPSSIYDDDAPILDRKVLDIDLPILGICYGLQMIADFSGCTISRSDKREYGRAELKISGDSDLFKDVGVVTNVWMSHGDGLFKLSEDFRVLGSTDNAPYEYCITDLNGIGLYNSTNLKDIVGYWNTTPTPLENFIIEKKCTCGAAKCGHNQHSDWCDLSEE